MKRWLLGHPGITAYVLWASSTITLLYGLGHIASAFGLEFDAIPAARRATHLLVGTSLMISSLAGRSVYLRFKKLNDRGKVESRQSMAQAIWQRAEQNYLEQTRARGR